MGNSVKINSTNQVNKKVLSDRCGVNDTLTLIGKRWLMTVLYEISSGNNQFTFLRKSIPEISEHILGTRINELVQHELITKKEIENTIPLQINYAVTIKGDELLSLVNELCIWNRNWEK
jgi:DNA-binding HxlR family transcriptional regulator